jgi:aldose 1-epimerase
MWHAGADLIPDRWDDVEPFRAADVDGLALDNTFTGWDRRVVVDGRAGRILIASDLDFLHVYAPKGRSYFCAEPVSAAPDAFNHPDRGMKLLAPGEELRAEMRVALG